MKPNSIWRLPAVGCTNLSNTGGRREGLYAAGYRRIDVLIAEGDQIHNANINELLAIGPSLREAGWTICTWHSTTGNSSPGIEAEAAYDAIILCKHLISGHNLNAEDWYEGSHRWKTGAYLEHLLTLYDLPVAVWPLGSDTASSVRDFDYQTCVNLGCMIYPQQYANVHPTYTISSGDLNLKAAGVPIENRGTSPGCYGSNIPWDGYASELRAMPRPVLLYAADLEGFNVEQAAKLVVTIPQEPPMGLIGTDHGIRAMFNRLRDKDPNGTLLKKGADGKWPSILSLVDIPVRNWKAYDKAERALTILVQDHDAAL